MGVLVGFDWLMATLYFLAVAGAAWWSSRRQATSAGYFLAGRNIGWFAIGGSLFASNIGSEHIVGLAGQGACHRPPYRVRRDARRAVPRRLAGDHPAAGVGLHHRVRVEPPRRLERVPGRLPRKRRRLRALAADLGDARLTALYPHSWAPLRRSYDALDRQVLDAGQFGRLRA